MGSRRGIVEIHVSSQKDNDSAFQRRQVLSTIVHNTREKLRVWKIKCANFHMGSVYTDVTEKMLADAENTSSAILKQHVVHAGSGPQNVTFPLLSWRGFSL